MTATTELPGDPFLSCSRVQEAIWFAEQASDIGAANNLPVTVEFDGRLDERRLTRAINDVIRAQPALRTRFAERHGRLLRREIEPHEVGTVDLRPEVVADPAAFVESRTRVPLDLRREPFVFHLLRTGADRHILYANFHHAVFDGTSKDIFVEDLARSYGSHALERRTSYGDHIVAETTRAAKLEEEAARYWVPTLPTVASAQRFPSSVHAASPADARGEALNFEIGGPLKREVDGLARRIHVSPFAVLIGAVQLLQHVYSGRGDGGVATLIPLGTRHGDVEDVIGMFVNEVPLLGAPRDDMRLDEYLRDVAGRVREVARLRHFPFNEAIARFGTGEDPQSVLPRFAVSYRKAVPTKPEFPGLRVVVDPLVPVYGRRWGARFRFLDLPSALIGRCEYDSSVLHEAAAQRLVDQFRTLLEAMVSKPEALLSELSPLPDGERRKLLSEFNATRVAREPMTLQQLFETQVDRNAEQPAATFEGRRLTYRDLNRRANVLAHHLIELGAGPDTRVGVYLERGLSLVVAVLAVAKAGAGHLPLDPSYPRERTTFMVEDSDAPIIVTQESLRLDVAGSSRHIVCIDGLPSAPPADPDLNPPVRATPDSLAYVIYTSGSTGRPKGAELVQRAVVNLVQTMCDAPGISADDVFLSVTTLAFDIGTVELVAPLSVGARVVIAPSEVAGDGRALAKLLDDCGATMMFATPSRWRLVVGAGWDGGQTVIVGGEALPTDLADALVNPRRAVWNIYGPTETTVFSTRKRLQSSHDITIGRPVANTSVYVLDRTGAPAPIGVPGELCIGGMGLARGYLNRPELTAERFVPDVFGEADGRLYKTGDLVRYDDDGDIEFLGRIDDQLKIRGFRVEPGEIEDTLLREPGVRRAAVVAWADARGDRRLVAYVVPRDGSLSVRELRLRLREQLPDFMVPAAFTIVPDLPLNPNGKIDRQRLPVPDFAGEAEDTYVEPRDRTERALASIWARVLDRERVGVEDNFFELGGHSLLAAEVVDRARDVLGEEVSLRHLFAAPTIRGMAAGLAAQSGTSSGSARFPRAPRTPVPDA